MYIFFKVFMMREEMRHGDCDAKVRFICLKTGIGEGFFVFLRGYGVYMTAEVVIYVPDGFAGGINEFSQYLS